MLELYETIYDAIEYGELHDSEYLFIKHDDEITILITVFKPNLLNRLNLWLHGYRFLITGSEAIRLYEESYSAEDFCQTLYDF